MKDLTVQTKHTMASKSTVSRGPSTKRLGRQPQQQPARWPVKKPAPPPVPKKPTLQERQRRHALHGAMARSDSLPPPIGYNDADRFYLTSPSLPPEASDWPNATATGDADSLGHAAAEVLLDDDYEDNDMNGDLAGNPNGMRREAERPFESSHVGTSPWLDRQLRQSNLARSSGPLVRRHAQTDTSDLDRDRERRQRHLEEQMSNLRAENRVKARELEANRYIEQQMNRKLKTTDEAFALRQAIKDKERIIASQEKILSELTSEVGRLTESGADRERLVMQLQSEVDNLERVLAAQRALREGERLQTVSEELDRAKDELAAASLETDALRNEVRNLQGAQTRKEREIKAKEEKISQLSGELSTANQTVASLKNELAVADSHAKAADREAKLLRDQNKQLSDVREKCRNLQDEKAYMAEAVRTLESKVAQLEAIKKDKEVLDDLVTDLKSALKDKNQVLKEHRDLQSQTQQLRDRVKGMQADDAGNKREINRLQEVLSELEKENQFYRDLDGDFRRLKQRYEEVDKALKADEMALAKLRPRIEKLQNRCKEKDDLIRRLANELRSGADRLPRELLQEADRNQGRFAEDYLDPAELTGTDEARPHSSRRDTRMGADNNSPIAAYEPAKRALQPVAPQSIAHKDPSKSDDKKVPSKSFTNTQGPSQRLPSMQPAAEQSKVGAPGRYRSPRNEKSPNRSPARQDGGTSGPENRGSPRSRRNDQQVHDPERYNNTSPGINEKPMKRLSDIPEQKTYEPVHRGSPSRNTNPAYHQQPSSNIEPQIARRQQSPQRQDPRSYDRQPTNTEPQNYEPRRQQSPQRQDPRSYDQQPTNTEPQNYEPRSQQSPQRFKPLEYSSDPDEGQPKTNEEKPEYSSREDSPSARGHEPRRQSPEKSDERPEQESSETAHLDPPTNLHARTLADGSILVEWDTPDLDQLDRNRSIVVAGYKIFINEIEEQSVGSSRLTKALVSRGIGLPVNTVAVQCYGYDGEVSDMARISIDPSESLQAQQKEPAPSHTNAKDETPIGAEPEQEEPVYKSTSSQQQHPQQQQQQQQQQQPELPSARIVDANSVVPQPLVRKALYDYQPGLNSPSAFPSYELELHRGDDVTTFGPIRPDGMYNAEVNGKRGLVPAQYLQLN